MGTTSAGGGGSTAVPDLDVESALLPTALLSLDGRLMRVTPGFAGLVARRAHLPKLDTWHRHAFHGRIGADRHRWRRDEVHRVR